MAAHRWLGGAGAALLLVVAATAYVSWVEHTTRSELAARIASRQAASNREFEAWMDQRVEQAARWAALPETRQLVAQLLALPNPTPQQLDTHPLQQALRARFAVAQGPEGLQGYYIVSRQGLSLGSLVAENLGTRNFLWREPEFFEQIRTRGAALSPLMPSDVHLENGGVTLDGHPITVLIGVPVWLDGTGPAAYFAIRIAPVGLLAQQSQARFGVGGVSYLVDAFGRLHADRAWLNLDLEQYGLDSEPFRGSSYLFARDPGKDLLANPGATGERRRLPLTRSALSVQRGDGASLAPYRNHRGVEVVGSWTWNPKLGLGILTEMPVSEAYAPVAAARQHVLLAATVLAILAAAVLMVRLHRPRPAAGGADRRRSGQPRQGRVRGEHEP